MFANHIPSEAVELFKQYYNDKPVKHERKDFKRFKALDCVKLMNFDEETVQVLYYSATGEKPYYVDRECYTHQDMKIYTELFSRFWNNLDATPRPAAELLGGKYETRTNYIITSLPSIKYNLECSWHDESRYISNFRKFIKKMSEKGIINVTPIKNCGKVAIYLYSLK